MVLPFPIPSYNLAYDSVLICLVFLDKYAGPFGDSQRLMVQHQILTPQADPMLHHFLARLLQRLDFILLVRHSQFKLC